MQQRPVDLLQGPGDALHIIRAKLRRLARRRYFLPATALGSWLLTYLVLALAPWNPELGFMKVVAAGIIVFVCALGLFGWKEFRRSRWYEFDDRFDGRTERSWPNRHWFLVSFFTGYTVGALLAAFACLRIAFG